jgi:hypothetical protein
MTINWTQFKGDYVKWTEVGQVVTGVVRAVRIGNYKDKQYPELVLDTEDGTRILSASQSALMRQLADDPPGVGESIRVEYLGEGETKQAGQNPVKLFKVTVEHKSGSVTAPADAPAPADLA